MTRVVCWLVVACACLVPSAAAQEIRSLSAVRALYESASYTEALAMVSAIDGVDALEYRALCELALGRPDDAAATVERLVTDAPTREFGQTDVPPRFAALVAQVREKTLPGLIRQAIADGRDYFQAGEYEVAAAQFRRAVTLAADAALPADASLADARTLAQGFLELAEARQAAASPEPAPSPPRAAAAAELPGVAPNNRMPGPPTPVAAVAIDQTLPPWPLRQDMPAPRGRGVIRVQIGSDGRVTHAAIEQPLDPRYDRRVLAASAGWRYQPATLNGVPIESERRVAFEIVP